MRLLLDTHLLLWVAGFPDRLSHEATRLISDPANQLLFSTASLWEIAIKFGLGRPDFRTDPQRLRRGLLDNGYGELPVTGPHAVAVAHLPNLHRDPFDRLLVAQAQVDGVDLLTADATVARYPGPIRRV